MKYKQNRFEAEQLCQISCFFSERGLTNSNSHSVLSKLCRDEIAYHFQVLHRIYYFICIIYFIPEEHEYEYCKLNHTEWT